MILVETALLVDETEQYLAVVTFVEVVVVVVVVVMVVVVKAIVVSFSKLLD